MQIDAAAKTDAPIASEAIKKVGIIGAGQMGNGIAHVVALGGYSVKLHDKDADQYGRAIEIIEGNLRRQLARKRISEADMSTALQKISNANELGALSDCDLVIEAATEDEAVKRKIFMDLREHVSEDTMLASNTSSISITRLASVCARPERFIGMHFMNPVPLMQLVELIRGIATDDQTFDTARTFVESLGKTT